MSLQDFHRIDEAYHNMYVKRTPVEDCEDREDESTPAEDKKKKMEYLKSKGMKTWPDENAEEGEAFNVGDYIADHDGSEYEVVDVLPDGDIVVTVAGASTATGRKMRVGKEFFKHFNKVEEEEDAEEELGVDPKEADELEAVMKKHGKKDSFFKDEERHEPDFEKTDVWKAYKTILAGKWSEDDFLQWSRSVWAAGAKESRRG